MHQTLFQAKFEDPVPRQVRASKLSSAHFDGPRHTLTHHIPFDKRRCLEATDGGKTDTNVEPPGDETLQEELRMNNEKEIAAIQPKMKDAVEQAEAETR